MSDPRICFDKVLPADLHLFDATGAAVFSAKRWDNGSTLTVKFFDGTADQQQMVKSVAPQWSEHANIKFDFNDANDANIRITFDPTLGAWSYLGIDCKTIPLNEPTMNLGWVDQGVILHEFGHALGLIHEHQNPNNAIEWDRDAVIEALSGPPNNWDLATIEHNMFKKYSQDIVKGTNVDKDSIMMYAFPNAWTEGDFETTENQALSALDKQFIGGANGYPKT